MDDFLNGSVFTIKLITAAFPDILNDNFPDRWNLPTNAKNNTDCIIGITQKVQIAGRYVSEAVNLEFIVIFSLCIFEKRNLLSGTTKRCASTK